MREYEKPTVTEESGPMGGTRTNHPAFAQIRAARVSGQTNLYGSEFSHNHFVTIAIAPSSYRRDLSNDWHFAEHDMIEVALSEAQWATFVSSMNCGSGVPCTLQYSNGERVPQIEHVDESKDKFKAEFGERFERAASGIQSLAKRIQEEKSLSKKKKDELAMALSGILSNITNNSQFVSDQFGEHVENTLEKAKVEVEAYLSSAINRAGVEALNGRSPFALIEGESE